MMLELSREQAKALKTALDTYGDELDRELVRTDKAELQHALKSEVDQLGMVRRKLERLVETDGAGEPLSH